MGVEIEAKMKLADRPALEARLNTLVGPPAVELFEINTYYDRPDGSLRASDQGLRLRVERATLPGGGEPVTTNIITHKGPRAHGRLKSRPETEVNVTDADAGHALLESLGFVAVLTFEKYRTRWHAAACHIELDRLPLIGDFVEIEGPAEADIMQLRDEIGLGDAPIVKPSYVAMLCEAVEDSALDTSYIGFT